ncbi:unnamed protein product [Arctogadus glacialis]
MRVRALSLRSGLAASVSVQYSPSTVPVARLIARGALRPGNEANGLGVKRMLLSTAESPCQNTSPEEAAAAAAAAAQQPVSGSAWATPQRTCASSRQQLPDIQSRRKRWRRETGRHNSRITQDGEPAG